jgi:hypothetical protein
MLLLKRTALSRKHLAGGPSIGGQGQGPVTLQGRREDTRPRGSTATVPQLGETFLKGQWTATRGHLGNKAAFTLNPKRIPEALARGGFALFSELLS